MENKPINIRSITGAEVLDAISGAYIADRFFGKSRAWFTQRLNNNIVNGKPIGFSPEELYQLRGALRAIATEIHKFTTHIPNMPTDMSVQVYIISDPELIEAVENNDIEAFRNLLDESESSYYFPEPETFDTEAEAIAFCDGLAFGSDERATAARLPMLTSDDYYLPFIEAIKDY